MNKIIRTSIVSKEIVLSKIYIFRGQKVMVDRDLAALYMIDTKLLKRQVKRNLERFPADFMFQLNKKEFENWRCQFGTSNLSDKMGLRYAPYVFTEHGVLMLSSVLNSPKAIQANIQIMRVFAQVRQALIDNTELRLIVEKLIKKTDNNSKNIELVFQYIDELTERKTKETPRKKIGYELPVIEQLTRSAKAIKKPPMARKKTGPKKQAQKKPLSK